MKFWIALLITLMFGVPSGAAAQVVVTSGEHPGFTRLVMQYAGPVDWQVGRTADGYDLRVKQQKPVYDVTKAFDLIGKSRLAAIWADPANGDLHFGIACACYAMPFEFRPGIVVVDLYDGTPPKGSAFEVPLDGPVPVAALPVTPKAQDVLPAYRWTDVAVAAVAPKTAVPLQIAPVTQAQGLSTVDLNLEPLRLSLMQELSRGASQGIVDMAAPSKHPPRQDLSADPSVSIHMGETPDLVIRQKGQGESPLTAQGEACLTDDQLDVPSWGASRPVADQLGPERQGLTGEFDKPDADAVTRAIRFQLFLGFGAEARNLIRAFPNNLPDKSVWKSMAHVLDQEPDAEPAFAGMAECDSAAALWATLADPAARPSTEAGKAAVLRSFSALPPHLRRLLGPTLVDRFLAAGDLTVATALRDAILRAPGDPGPGIILMQAKMDHALGKPGKAETQLEGLATASGPGSAEALVALVEQKAVLGQSVDFAQVQALEELLKERNGGTDAPRFQHALILARAASGDFDGAFAGIDTAPDATATLWHLLAQSGPDSALLTHAITAEGELPPLAAKDSASLIADRLLGLGLADQAAAWVKLDDAAPALLKARIILAQGDPQAAIALLGPDETPAAVTIKAQSLMAMGQTKDAAALYAQIGKPDDQWSALTQTEDWGAVANGGPASWKALADIVTSDQAAAPVADPTNPGATGPLARNKALLQDSTATRDAITALLDQVKAPVVPTQ